MVIARLDRPARERSVEMKAHSLVLPVALVIIAMLQATPAPSYEKIDVTKVAEDNSAFAFDLYSMLRGAEGNLFLSPYSISTALAMTYAGARGQTQQEMETVLHFSLGQERLHRPCSELQRQINSIKNEGHLDLSVANSLWCQEGYPFLESYLDLTERHYGAGLHFVHFAEQTEAARRAINAWVEDETEEKIKNLIKQGVLDHSTALVLCNAVYFRGDWARQFDVERTREADFYLSSDRTVKVPMMTQTSELKFKRFEGFSALELPYEGGDLSMIVLLPDAVDGLMELEDNLTEANVSKWIKELDQSEPSTIHLEIPRFKTTGEFELAEILAKMGMPSAFGAADFSGMTSRGDLHISNVIHKAFIDVSEQGTEAAAATAVVKKRGTVERPPAFQANHPFVLLIREAQSGSILFMGRIADPTM
jgi:serpin B